MLFGTSRHLSVGTFAIICIMIASTIDKLEELGFKRPTDIQYKAIPSILKLEDVLAIAQTGTGKTAAFAIPVINLLHVRKEYDDMLGIKCLVMVPTHEFCDRRQPNWS